jgi:hypothetical protein
MPIRHKILRSSEEGSWSETKNPNDAAKKIPIAMLDPNISLLREVDPMLTAYIEDVIVNDSPLTVPVSMRSDPIGRRGIRITNRIDKMQFSQ